MRKRASKGVSTFVGREGRKKYLVQEGRPYIYIYIYGMEWYTTTKDSQGTNETRKERERAESKRREREADTDGIRVFGKEGIYVEVERTKKKKK